MNFIWQSTWLSFLEIVHGGDVFHMIILVYAYIGKILNMWLTSIANFSDGGIDVRKFPWFGDASGSNLPPPPPPPNMTPMETFLLAQADMMRQILQNQQQMNQQRNDQLEEDPRVATYAQFFALKPPLFHKAEEPLEADAWLRAIEAKLDVLTSPCSEERKVKFAAMYLRGPALLWWDHYKMMQPNGHEITWAEFKTAFKNHHIPKGMVERKLNELLNLRQGSDSVYQNARKINNLCQYGDYYVDTDAKKMDRFHRVLDPELYKKLNPIKTNSYHEIVDLAISQEDAMKKVQNAN
jgi:hypothetical protein